MVVLLPRAGDAGQEDHSLAVPAEFFQRGRQVEGLEVGDEVVHPPRDQADFAHLVKHVDAEPPSLVVDFERVGEIHPAVLDENPLPPLVAVDHRQDQPVHFLRGDRPPIQRPQRAVDAHERRAADLQVQIAPLQLHHRPEKLVDRQLVVLAGRRPRIVLFCCCHQSNRGYSRTGMPRRRISSFVWRIVYSP